MKKKSKKKKGAHENFSIIKCFICIFIVSTLCYSVISRELDPNISAKHEVENQNYFMIYKSSGCT